MNAKWMRGMSEASMSTIIEAQSHFEHVFRVEMV